MRISKRVLAAASTLALAGSVAAVSISSSAGAAPLPKHDATNDTVTCNDVLGKIKFATALHLGGVTPNSITITVKSGDCASATAGIYDPTLNPTGISLKSYAAKGILSSTNNDCLGLSGLTTGTSGGVPGKFATNPATPALLDATSTLNVTQAWGGTFNDGGVTSPATDSDSWGGTYGFFSIGGSGSGNALGSGQSNTSNPSVTGSFQGSNNGNTSRFAAATAQSAGDLGTQCFSTTGIKGITFSIGGFTLQ